MLAGMLVVSGCAAHQPAPRPTDTAQAPLTAVVRADGATVTVRDLAEACITAGDASDERNDVERQPLRELARGGVTASDAWAVSIPAGAHARNMPADATGARESTYTCIITGDVGDLAVRQLDGDLYRGLAGDDVRWEAFLAGF